MISYNWAFFPLNFSITVFFHPSLSFILPPSIYHSLETPAHQIHSFVSLSRNHISHLFLDNRQSPSCLSSQCWLHTSDCHSPYHIAIFNLPSHVKHVPVCFLTVSILSSHSPGKMIQGRMWLMPDDHDLDAARVPPSL